jgi:hypothetical protein
MYISVLYISLQKLIKQKIGIGSPTWPPFPPPDFGSMILGNRMRQYLRYMKSVVTWGIQCLYICIYYLIKYLYIS